MERQSIHFMELPPDMQLQIKEPPLADPASFKELITSEMEARAAVELLPASRDEQPVVQARNKESFWRSRSGKLLMKLGAIASFATAGIAAFASPAAANTAAVQHVYNTGGEGLWLHPDSSDAHSAVSDLMPDGTEFDVDCHTTGTNIEGDNAWLHGTDMATGHTGYAADKYVDTNVHQGAEDAELTQLGIPACGSDGGSNDPQPAATVPPFVTLDRNAAARWAIDHAEDKPPNDGSCTIFASRDLWTAGVPQTSDWNDNLNFIKYGWRNGSRDAWAAENYVEYMRTQPFAEIEPLGQMSPSNNNVPDARLGDEIGYDWDNDGSIDHIDVITGFSGQYPLVSGWSEDGAKRSPI